MRFNHETLLLNQIKPPLVLKLHWCLWKDLEKPQLLWTHKLYLVTSNSELKNYFKYWEHNLTNSYSAPKTHWLEYSTRHRQKQYEMHILTTCLWYPEITSDLCFLQLPMTHANVKLQNTMNFKFQLMQKKNNKTTKKPRKQHNSTLSSGKKRKTCTFILICVTWNEDSVPVERMILALVFPVSVRKPKGATRTEWGWKDC